MRITAVLEGPISFDGKHYLHAKGERLYLDNLAKNVDQLTLMTYVFRPDHADYASASHSPFESRNLNVVELPFDPDRKYNPLGKLLHFLRVFGTIWRNTGGVEMYYFFLPSYPSAMTWLINKLHRRPYLVYAASDWEEISGNLFKWHSTKYKTLFPVVKCINGLLERRIAKKALFCVTAGAALRRKYEGFNLNVHETTPRITVSRQDVFYRDDTCTGEVVKIISVGDLIPRKNLELLMRAVADYRASSHRRVSILLVGVGPMEKDLRARAAELGLESDVIFKGYVTQETDLYALYREADIYALTSYSEGFPRVLYEAMSQSLPVITTDCGGVTGVIVNGKNGLVVKVGDCHAMTSAIERMVLDGELRKKIIENARQTILGVIERMDPVQIPRLIEHYAASANTNVA